MARPPQPNLNPSICKGLFSLRISNLGFCRDYNLVSPRESSFRSRAVWPLRKYSSSGFRRDGDFEHSGYLESLLSLLLPLLSSSLLLLLLLLLWYVWLSPCSTRWARSTAVVLRHAATQALHYASEQPIERAPIRKGSIPITWYHSNAAFLCSGAPFKWGPIWSCSETWFLHTHNFVIVHALFKRTPIRNAQFSTWAYLLERDITGKTHLWTKCLFLKQDMISSKSLLCFVFKGSSVWKHSISKNFLSSAAHHSHIFRQAGSHLKDPSTFIPVSVKKHSSGEEEPLDNQLEQHQGRGWRGVSATVFHGQGLCKRCVSITDTYSIVQYSIVSYRIVSYSIVASSSGIRDDVMEHFEVKKLQERVAAEDATGSFRAARPIIRYSISFRFLCFYVFFIISLFLLFLSLGLFFVSFCYFLFIFFLLFFFYVLFISFFVLFVFLCVLFSFYFIWFVCYFSWSSLRIFYVSFFCVHFSYFFFFFLFYLDFSFFFLIFIILVFIFYFLFFF